jgi:hypothetical protein
MSMRQPFGELSSVPASRSDHSLVLNAVEDRIRLGLPAAGSLCMEANADLASALTVAPRVIEGRRTVTPTPYVQGVATSTPASHSLLNAPSKAQLAQGLSGDRARSSPLNHTGGLLQAARTSASNNVEPDNDWICSVE